MSIQVNLTYFMAKHNFPQSFLAILQFVVVLSLLIQAVASIPPLALHAGIGNILDRP